MMHLAVTFDVWQGIVLTVKSSLAASFDVCTSKRTWSLSQFAST